MDGKSIEAGLAMGGVALTNRDTGCAPSCQFRPRDPQTGYVLGVGADYMLNDKTTIGVNYRYADLGRDNRTGMTSGTAVFEDYDVDASGGVLSLRVSMLFNRRFGTGTRQGPATTGPCLVIAKVLVTERPWSAPCRWLWKSRRYRLVSLSMPATGKVYCCSQAMTGWLPL